MNPDEETAFCGKLEHGIADEKIGEQEYLKLANDPGLIEEEQQMIREMALDEWGHRARLKKMAQVHACEFLKKEERK